jgi:hypothetical protein
MIAVTSTGSGRIRLSRARWVTVSPSRAGPAAAPAYAPSSRTITASPARAVAMTRHQSVKFE